MENNSSYIELNGTVDTITYRSKDSGYTVLKLTVSKELIVVAGTMPYVSEGDTLKVHGNYVIHPVYGQQFKCEYCEIAAPETQGQILKYLSSGAIKGVGPSTALKIVELFKEESLEVIESSPQRLTVIKGISKEKAESISEQYKQQFGVRDIMMILSRFKISPTEAANVFKTLGTRSVDLIKENPYLLCKEGIGFAFDRVDEIASNLGIKSDSNYRISAGIVYILKSNLSNGHTCLPTKKLVDVAVGFLDVSKESILCALNSLIDSMQLYCYELEGRDFIFLPDYACAEEYISTRIRASMTNNTRLYDISEQELNLVQKRLGIEFDPVQIAAVNEAMRNSMFILTGGPGTGKTTTLNAIIEVLDNRQMSIALAAPTGRAAKRMSEITGRDASTLHRLLEVEWGQDSMQYFVRNKTHPLDYDVIIVDEMSMVDVQLFKALLDATRLSTRLVLVGDSDQLPSVGAGNVLNDLISSDIVPVVRLEKIFRQAAESSIVNFAHQIIEGKIPDKFEKANDFFFLKRADAFSVVNTVVELNASRLPEAYGLNSLSDIQVLCPSRKKEVGTVNLNSLLQDKLNPLKKNSPELHFKGCSYRIGDKVMHIKNDYDIIWENDKGQTGTGVYNGDIGFIEDIDLRNRMVKIRYEDKVATYYEDNLGLLEHAYAVTVHKSQGCEFDCVIIPLYDTANLLRYRNLLYTAITRAKRLVILVGDVRVFEDMIKNDRKALRYTALKNFIIGI